MSRIQFNQTPYTVSYMKDGKQETIRRIPPPKMHDIMPDDEVKLKVGKNDDYKAGDDFQVKHISVRQPNVLQLVDKNGNTTFVDAYDVEMVEQRGVREGVDPRDLPINNRYLLWP